MVLGVAEPLVEHLEVCGADADGVLGRHADAAVQLDRLLADVAAGAGDLQADPVGGVGDDVAVAAAIVIVAQSTMLCASSSETYMSAARNVSAWKVLRVTPNCLRLLR